VLQCLGTAETDDADLFLARAEIAIVADADFRCEIYSAISYMNCVVVKSQEVVVVLTGSGSEFGTVEACRGSIGQCRLTTHRRGDCAG
jgi:hypothetical protein